MKKTDIAMIVLIASVSVLVAYFTAKAIPVFSTSYSGSAKVKTIDLIEANIKNQPDPAIFNKNAINPAVQVTINGTK